MRIAVGSDMKTNLTDVVVANLKARGFEVDLFGALVTQPAPWSRLAVEVAEQVSLEKYDQAILFCWTGTGISIAANKVRGIRCALCGDAETARGARIWNDANILALSIRTTSEWVAIEILDAWFQASPSDDRDDIASLEYLQEFQEKYLLPVESE